MNQEACTRQVRNPEKPLSALGGAQGLVGVRIRGTLGDIDPLNKVPFKRAISRAKKGPLQAVSPILPRTWSCGPLGWSLNTAGIRKFGV